MPTSHTITRLLVTAFACSALASPVLAQAGSPLQLCVVENDRLREVAATYNPATRDTLVDGQRFATRFPNRAYAPAREWSSNASRNFLTKDYLKYGLPRRLSPGDLRIFLYVTGVPVFTENSAEGKKAEVVYVLMNAGCEFQPYQEATAQDLHASAQAVHARKQYAMALETLGLKTLLAYGPSLVLRGHMFAAGEGVRRDTAYARTQYMKGIEAGDPDGYEGFARLALATGNDAAAVTHYRMAADHGSGTGAAQLAARYLTGRGVTASPEEAAYYLRIAVDQLDEQSVLLDSARTSLAQLYTSGRGVRRDASAHFMRDLEAAQRADPWAQYLMGRRFETGMAVILDREVAVEFYRRSAARKYAPSVQALERLGIGSR